MSYFGTRLGHRKGWYRGRDARVSYYPFRTFFRRDDETRLLIIIRASKQCAPIRVNRARGKKKRYNKYGYTRCRDSYPSTVVCFCARVVRRGRFAPPRCRENRRRRASAGGLLWWGEEWGEIDGRDDRGSARRTIIKRRVVWRRRGRE